MTAKVFVFLSALFLLSGAESASHCPPCPCDTSVEVWEPCDEFCLDHGTGLNQTRCQNCCNACCPHDGYIEDNSCIGFAYSDFFNCTHYGDQDRALMVSHVEGVLGKCEEISDAPCPPCNCTTTTTPATTTTTPATTITSIKTTTPECQPCPCPTCDSVTHFQQDIQHLAGDAEVTTIIANDHTQEIGIDNSQATKSSIFVIESGGYPNCPAADNLNWLWNIKVAIGSYKVTLVELQMNHCGQDDQGIHIGSEHFFSCYTAGQTVNFEADSEAIINFLSGVHSMAVFRVWIIVPAGCPANYDYNAQFNACYRYNSDLLTWQEARAACLVDGGDLTSVNSEEENQFIEATYIDGSTQRVYMGLNSLDDPVTYVFSDGSPVTFTDWYTGEPNNSNGIEHCVHWYGSSILKWNDIDCSRQYPSVCKYTV